MRDMELAEMEPLENRKSLRTGDVARALGLAPATVQGYARDGRIPATRTPGGQYRFDLAEVRRVLFPEPLVPLTSPRRFVDIFETVAAVLPGSRDVLDEEALRSGSQTGFHREAWPEPVVDDSAPDRRRPVNTRVIRHLSGARRAASVLADAPVAAFSVLR